MNKDNVTLPPTSMQLVVLNEIRRYAQAKGTSPTLRELAKLLDLAPVTIQGHITGLVERGILRRVKNASRGLILADTCPTCGAKIACPKTKKKH